MTKISVFVASVLVLVGCREKSSLHIYTWADYFDPTVVQAFERDNDCEVVIDTFDSNESMFAKLKAGASGYDIITPTSYQIPLLVKNDLLSEIDHSNISNVMNCFDSRYAKYVYDVSMKYSIPYSISYTGIIYDKKFVSEDEVASWNVFSNPKFRLKTMLLNDMREVLSIALMTLGKDINTESREDISESTRLICDWKKYVRKMDSESYKTDVPSGAILVGHGYSGDSLQVILGDGESEGREDIGFVLPESGFIVCCDEFAILKTASRKDLAYKFIDFIYQKDNSIKNMMYLYSMMPHKYAIAELGEPIKSLIIPSDSKLEKGRVFKSFEDNQEVTEMYNDAWDVITTFKGR